MATTDLRGYTSIFNPNTLTKKGLCPVTEIKHETSPIESHSLYYEIHGNGPEKIMLVMGLNASCFGWINQVNYFANEKKYTVLVFDNRGVGNSGTPRGPYSTSAMAEDAIVLLDAIGWTDDRDIHVVGISMGGMISQELATRIPRRIASLTLAVTTAGGWPWQNLPPWKGFYALNRLNFFKEPKLKVPVVVDMCFPTAWLDLQAPEDSQGRTNRQLHEEKFLARMQVTRQQSIIGALSQMFAGLTHRVTPDRLRTIGMTIPKVLIITGDDDHLVHPYKSRYLAQHIPGSEFIEWKGVGHVLNMQRPGEFHEVLERTFKEGRDRVDQGLPSSMQ